MKKEQKMSEEDFRDIKNKLELCLGVMTHSKELTGANKAEIVFYKKIQEALKNTNPKIRQEADRYLNTYFKICEADCSLDELGFNNGNIIPFESLPLPFTPRYGRDYGEEKSWETLQRVEDL